MEAKFSPSLMCMDFLHVGEQVDVLNDLCDYYHADIMDGHFVKNLCLSLDFVAAVKSIAKKPIDCHLMTTNPEDYVDRLIGIDADIISPHAETLGGQAFRLIGKIKGAGKGFGLVLNPETELSTAKAYLGHVDLLTIMSVDPGFSGQKFIDEVLDKISQAVEWKEKYGYTYEIAVDGGCKRETYKRLYDAGTECFIIGNTGLFSLDSDLSNAWGKMRTFFQESIERL
ncbi:D-allulose-6-phosphate 3-epimerase [Selenomonas sp. TAMA-11512]|uniref:D-allulose 6-phosphate 3-epimerase n=1 Tax=Selenomonas sp. TAMA-11512 TaxID=3095337 RepID=UPI003085757E|nr:D-allulose-6-phosphate 3-epimerase [Selenomonas sp. TAMA-11512]